MRIKRHWTCDGCAMKLAVVGFTTLQGSLLQSGAPVCGWTGPVRCAGQEVRPPPAKWAKVRVPVGKLRYKVGSKPWASWQPSDLGEPPGEWSRPNRLALAGFAITGLYPVVPRISLYNALKVLAGRVFRVPKNMPKAEAFRMAWDAFDLLAPGLRGLVMRMGDQEWLDSMPAARRRALQRAMRLVYQRGWCSEWAEFAAFIKTEKLPGFDKSGTEFDPVTEAGCIERLIQGPADPTHCIAGPWLKPLMHRLKSVWNIRSPIFYGSQPRQVIDQWFNLDHSYLWEGITVACDYSMFDNCHSDHSWVFMEQLYAECGMMVDERFADVMKAWRAPRGRLSGKGWCIRYQASTMNASGRDDTALANAVLNGFAMFCALASALASVPILGLRPNIIQWAMGFIRLSVTGDDSLAFVKGVKDLERFQEQVVAGVAAFGFEAKLLYCPRIFDMVYLGMRPYPVGGRWFFGRTIGRALYKFGWKAAPLKDDLGAWFAGECVATIAVESHVPVLSDVARSYLAWWGKRPITRSEPDHNRPWTTGDPTPAYDDSTLRYVAAGYGVSLFALQDLLAEIKNIRAFPFALAHPVLEAMVRADDL